MGYTDMWGTTPRVMLDNNRMVNSRNCTYDLRDYTVGDATPDTTHVARDNDIDPFQEHLKGIVKKEDTSTTTITPTISEGDSLSPSTLDLPEVEVVVSPLVETTRNPLLDDSMEVLIEPLDTKSFEPQGTTRSGCGYGVSDIKYIGPPKPEVDDHRD